jgi:hypothetical protein
MHALVSRDRYTHIIKDNYIHSVTILSASHRRIWSKAIIYSLIIVCLVMTSSQSV